DAREEYERAYDEPDEPAGVSERPRLRHPVPPAHSGQRGRRGGPGRAPALGGHRALSHARRAPRLHLSSADSAGPAPGRGTPGARGPMHQAPGSSVVRHTPGRGRQGRPALVNARIANGTASRRRNHHRVKGESTMTTNRVRVLMTQIGIRHFLAMLFIVLAGETAWAACSTGGQLAPLYASPAKGTR